MSQQVIDEIIAAFAGVPRPKILKVLSEGEEEWEEGRKARQNLLGKDWREIDASFLTQNSAAFYGLTPEAYQYYLPARMVCSLNSPPDCREVIVYTILSLLPNFWHLMYEGHDEQFDNKHSLLTEQQRYVVCSFLGAMFEEPFNYKGWSAQCLKWGWNIPHHPASAKIRDYYHSLYNFHYIPAINPKIRRLIKQIRTAFEDTPAPSNIFNRPMFRKGDPEGPDYALEFQGLNWRTIHPNFLSSSEMAPIFFSDEEFRYFLPAFMIADVWCQDKYKSNRDDSTNFGSCSAVFHLTQGFNKLVAQQILEAEKQYAYSAVVPDNSTNQTKNSRDCRDARFTNSERSAIIAYLKFKLVENTHRRGQLQIKRALKNYWLRTL